MNTSEQQKPDFNFGSELPPNLSGNSSTPINSISCMVRKSLPISQIVKDPDLQLRAAMNPQVISEYKEAMKAGASFPPVTVFDDGSGKLLLADGWHTLQASLENQCTDITANIRNGDKQAAMQFAASANATHGERRTRADKRRAVTMILGTNGALSNRQLGEICKVSDTFVKNVRDEIELKNGIKNENRIGRDGVSRRVPLKTPENRIKAPIVSPQTDAVESSVVTNMDFSKPCEEIQRQHVEASRNEVEDDASVSLIESAWKSQLAANDIEIRVNGKLIYTAKGGVYLNHDKHATHELISALKMLSA